MKPFDYWASRGMTCTSPPVYRFGFDEAHLHRRGNVDSNLVLVACLCLLLDSHKSTKEVGVCMCGCAHSPTPGS